MKAEEQQLLDEHKECLKIRRRGTAIQELEQKITGFDNPLKYSTKDKSEAVRLLSKHRG